jgi:hypothetical protein
LAAGLSELRDQKQMATTADALPKNCPPAELSYSRLVISTF